MASKPSSGHSEGGISQSITGDSNLQVGGDLVLKIEKLSRNLPSFLSEVIPALTQRISESDEDDSEFQTYEIEQKIEYNRLGAYQVWIRQYGQYGATVDQIYDEFDNTQPGAKNRILRHIKAKYDRIKSELFKDALKKNSKATLLETVQQHADDIIKRTADEIRDELLGSDARNLRNEDLEVGPIVIVCHAFINCKVLEKPKVNATG